MTFSILGRPTLIISYTMTASFFDFRHSRMPALRDSARDDVLYAGRCAGRWARLLLARAAAQHDAASTVFLFYYRC